MPEKHAVQLRDGDRHQMRSLIRAAHAPARTLTHARVLLKADEELTDEQIAVELDVGADTIARVRQRYARRGLAPGDQDG